MTRLLVAVHLHPAPRAVSLRPSLTHTRKGHVHVHVLISWPHHKRSRSGNRDTPAQITSAVSERKANSLMFMHTSNHGRKHQHRPHDGVSVVLWRCASTQDRLFCQCGYNNRMTMANLTQFIPTLAEDKIHDTRVRHSKHQAQRFGLHG